MTAHRGRTETLTVIHGTGGTVNAEGEVVGQATTETTYLGRVEPLNVLSAREDSVNRQGQAAIYAVTLPAEAVVTPQDRIRWQGAEYPVDGIPIRYHASTAVAHVECRIRVVFG